MTRPRVLLLGDSLSVGGTEGQLAEIAAGLDRSRWDVDVACVRAEGPLRERLEASGLRPWSCGPSSLKSPGLPRAMRRLAAHLRRHETQVVHCFGFYSNCVGVPAARLARTPVVVASQRDMGDLRPRSQRYIHSATLRLATHVLVNSAAIAAQLSRTRAAVEGRVVVIPNGVDLGRFRPSEGSVRRSIPTVGTLANLRREKGLPQLLEAAREVVRSLPRTRFVIWGDGPLRADLERSIGDLGLTAVVELRGATQEPAAALRDIDIFVLPSLSEASPNVILEAMATGLPVVATRVGGVPGLVDDPATAVLVAPDDPTALAQAITRLLQHPPMAAAMGERGRIRAAAEFGMDRMLERIDGFYCRALGPTRGAPAPRRATQPV